jgi:diamine N-acetyltransferase
MGETGSPTLRRAGPGDLERLLGFVAALYAEDGSIPFVRDRVSAALLTLMGDDSLGRVWLIEVDGSAAGYLVAVWGFSLEWHGRDAFVDELFVDPAHRRRGLGTAALRRAETECLAAGVRALHLEVERSNPRAQALYRREGYRDHDRYLMTKRLGQPGWLCLGDSG